VALVLPKQQKPLAGAWLTSTEMPLLPLMMHALLVIMAAPLLLNQMLLQPPRLTNALAKRATTETVRRAQRASGPTLLPQDPPALLVALVLPKQQKPLAGAWLTSTEMPLLPLMMHALLVIMAAPLLLNQMLLQPPRVLIADA
jgi:flagellar biosynthesis protein FlhB